MLNQRVRKRTDRGTMVGEERNPNHRNSFNPKWKLKGFVEDNGKALCTLCGSIVVYRTSSINRHFISMHAMNVDLETDKKEVIDCAIAYYQRFKDKNDVGAWFKEMNKMYGVSRSVKIPSWRNDKLKLTTGCSFALAQFLAERGKPLTDADYIKQAFIACADVLFDDLNNKNIILSRLTSVSTSQDIMERRAGEIAEFLRRERIKRMEEASAYGVALTLQSHSFSSGEETGSGLRMIVRFCGGDSVFENPCCEENFEKVITSHDVLTFVRRGLERSNISFDKVFSFITDNSEVFTDAEDGFLVLLERELGRTVLKYHCLLDLDRLLVVMSKGRLLDVVRSVGKFVSNLLRESPALENMFQPYTETIKRTQFERVPLLGDGKVLEIVACRLDSLKNFLMSSDEEVSELTDESWLGLLMYTADVVAHLSDFKRSLLSEDHTVLDLFQTWKAFIEKIKLLNRDLSSKSYEYFPRLRNFCANNKINFLDECLEYTEMLMLDFIERLDCLYGYEKVLPFLVEPHTFEPEEINFSLFPTIIVEFFKQQFVTFRNTESLYIRFSELRQTLKREDVNRSHEILQCWNTVPNKFLYVKSIAFSLLSAFGTVTPPLEPTDSTLYDFKKFYTAKKFLSKITNDALK